MVVAMRKESDRGRTPPN